MSRAALDDKISYCKRELLQLEQMVTNCESCDNKKYKRHECLKHGLIPTNFISRTDCPDWTISEIPF